MLPAPPEPNSEKQNRDTIFRMQLRAFSRALTRLGLNRLALFFAGPYGGTCCLVTILAMLPICLCICSPFITWWIAPNVEAGWKTQTVEARMATLVTHTPDANATQEAGWKQTSMAQQSIDIATNNAARATNQAATATAEDNNLRLTATAMAPKPLAFGAPAPARTPASKSTPRP